MKKNNDFLFAIIAIIAVVAIVGLIVLVNAGGVAVQDISGAAKSSVSGGVIPQTAYKANQVIGGIDCSHCEPGHDMCIIGCGATYPDPEDTRYYTCTNHCDKAYEACKAGCEPPESEIGYP